MKNINELGKRTDESEITGSLELDYNSITNRNINNPDLQYGFGNTFVPMKPSGQNLTFEIGPEGNTTNGQFHNAYSNAAVETYANWFIFYILQIFDQMRFTPNNYGANWAEFASSSFNGIHTINFSKSTDYDEAGGYVEYYYHESAWKVAFNGNMSAAIIAQSGSVYKDSIAPENLVVAWDGTIGPAGSSLEIDYTTSGTDRNLTSPEAIYSTNNFRFGSTTEGDAGDIELLIGLNSWQIQASPLGGISTWDQNFNSTYGIIKFSAANLSGSPWATFADTANNGLKVFNLPKSANNDNLGGYFEYYYHKAAYENAFIGNNQAVVVAQSGSVYKGSISDQNLVVAWDGTIGPAGANELETEFPSISSRFLDTPNDAYNTKNQLLPLLGDHSGAGGDLLELRLLANDGWYRLSNDQGAWSPGLEVLYAGNGWGSPLHGVWFSINGEVWDTFASNSFDGLQTMELPKSSSGDSLGGYFEYYYHQTAWTTAFNGNGSEVVIAQSGSVYKGSISTANLVVAWDGTIGPAGGGAGTAPSHPDELLSGTPGIHPDTPSDGTAPGFPLYAELGHTHVLSDITDYANPTELSDGGVGVEESYVTTNRATNQIGLHAGRNSSGQVNGTAVNIDVEDASNGGGGSVNITAGRTTQTSAPGGSLNLRAGIGGGNSGGDGGSVNITAEAGNGDANAGSVNITVANQAIGLGGSINLFAGPGGIRPGNVNIAGASTYDLNIGTNITNNMALGTVGRPINVAGYINSTSQIVSALTTTDYNGNTTPSFTHDCNNGNTADIINLDTSSMTFNEPTNAIQGGVYEFILHNSGGTNGAVTFSGFTGTNIYWEQNTAYTPTQVAGSYDILVLQRRSFGWVGTYTKDFRNS